MKKITNLFQTAACSALFIILASVGAQAAEIPSSAITIDYDNQKLIIKETGTNTGTDINVESDADIDIDQQVYFGIPTIKKVKLKGASAKSNVMSASVWDTYDYDAANGVVIDLSWLNRKKENYIQVKGNKNSDPVTIQIPAVMTKVSAAFDAEDASVTINDATDKKNLKPMEGKEVEYRTQYSGWNAYDAGSKDLSMYQERGATLYFRLSAHGTESLSTTDPTPEILKDIVDAEGKSIQAYEAGIFPGVEMKVAVKKRAAAPKISADYAKRQFSLPKNTEYRVITAKKVSGWKKTGTQAKKLDLSEISADIAGVSSATLEVRTEAKGTAPHSLSSRLEFLTPVELTVYRTVDGNEDPVMLPQEEMLEADIIDNRVEEYDGTDYNICVDVGYQYRQSTGEFEGICIYNLTSDVYEAYVSKDGKAPSSNAKLYTIRAKTSKDNKHAETKISSKYVSVGDYIYIRRKGKTKDKVWTSDFAGLGKVAYSKEEHYIDG